MALNPTYLSAFRAVAQAGGFTRAADSTCVSQPALSKQVAALERAIGVILFHRHPRRVALTEAGETLFRYVKQIDGLMEQAERAMHDLAHLRRGRLRVGATPTVGTYFLPQTIVYFRQRYPDIDLHAEVQSAGVLADRLMSRQIDVVLSTAPTNDARLRITPICPVPLVAVTAPSLDTSEKLPLILRDTADIAKVRPAIARRDPVDAENILTYSSTEAMKQAARIGLGIAIVPEWAVRTELQAGALAVVPLRRFRAAHAASWLERPDEPRSKLATAFFCIVKHAARGSLKSPKKPVLQT